MQTPILDMLINYIKTDPISFHVPGHRNGRGLLSCKLLLSEPTDESTNEIGSRVISETLTVSLDRRDYMLALQKIMEIDITELSITDDLHQPEGAILAAQALAAELYGVQQSFFLVGGSTVGNIASILSVCEQGDTIIVQRNAHKSVINGCKLAGVNIVFVYPEVDEASGYTTVPSYSNIERAIQQYQHAKAVFLTSPNYYGMSVSLKYYSELIHQNNMVFIVDEAHGAHYGLHPSLPQSAIQYGADLVVHSTHKTLPAFTMSAMLHVNSERVNAEIVQEQLMMVQSSSPSFVLLAGLDIARAILQAKGYELIEQSLKIKQRLIEDCEKLQLSIAIEQYSNSSSNAIHASVDSAIKEEHSNSHATIQYDPLRLHVYDRKQRLNGSELQSYFEQQAIWVEMSSQKHCILVMHLGYTDEEYDQLLDRLKTLDSYLKTVVKTEKKAQENRVSSYYNSNRIDEPVMLKRHVHRTTELRLFDEAIGQLCGETITPYPPGIPIIYVGERVTAEKLAEIRTYIQFGYNIQGNSEIYDGLLKIIVN